MQKLHAVQVPAGQDSKLTIPKDYGFHLLIIAAPHGANGKSVVYATIDGKAFAIGTVDTATKNFQVTVDLVFSGKQSAEVVFSAKGNIGVHLRGYVKPANPFIHHNQPSPQQQQPQLIRHNIGVHLMDYVQAMEPANPFVIHHNHFDLVRAQLPPLPPSFHRRPNVPTTKRFDLLQTGLFILFLVMCISYLIFLCVWGFKLYR